jgi:hypothetical protein
MNLMYIYDLINVMTTSVPLTRTTNYNFDKRPTNKTSLLRDNIDKKKG